MRSAVNLILYPTTSYYVQVFGHNPYRQHVTARDGHISDKAAQVLGVILPNTGGRDEGSDEQGIRRSHRQAGAGQGSRGGVGDIVDEEVR